MEENLQLPKWWKRLNFFALHLSYIFILFFAALQWPFVERILTKAFGQAAFDVINGWALSLWLITFSASGILGVVRSDRIKKIINLFENDKRNP